MPTVSPAPWLGGGRPPQGSFEGRAWKSVTQQYFVDGCNPGLGAGVLKQAVDALRATIDYGDEHPDFENLRLFSIQPDVFDKRNPNRVVLNLGFKDVSSMEGIGVLRGGASLQQIATERDPWGNWLVVGHQFAPEDPDYTGPTPDYQIATVQVDATDYVLEGSYDMRRAHPDRYATAWNGYVNSRVWRGGAAGRWKCITCEPELLDASTTPWTYRYHFQFQFHPDGWNYNFAYQVPRTGRLPNGVISGFGARVLVWNPSRDLNAIPWI